MDSGDGKSKSRPQSFSVSTDIVDFIKGRNQHFSIIAIDLKELGMERIIASKSFNESDDGDTEHLDHLIEIILATTESIRNVGRFISDGDDANDRKVGILFADWKGEPVARKVKMKWRDDSEIAWLERHMELSRLFIFIGKSPGLIILGEPTHDREDLSETERHFPDISRLRGYVVPAGCGIKIKKGTWYDFPVGVGPDITVLDVRSLRRARGWKNPAPWNLGFTRFELVASFRTSHCDTPILDQS